MGFLTPALLLICGLSIFPTFKAFITSFKTGSGINLTWTGLSNYIRIFQDTVFIQSMKNCIIYLIVQVPIMLVLALILASILNDRKIKARGLFRTAIFLPCATSLVAYAIIFRSLFATDGFINLVLIKLGIIDTAYNFLSNATAAKLLSLLH